MFNSVALDVVIGLVFVYLLYSLLATVLSEIIATSLSLRARNLKEAVNRMLTDEQKHGYLRRLWDSLRLLKNPKNEIITNFYDHPEIKYLGSSGVFRDPSSFKAVSFSKTLFSVLFGNGPVTKETITATLEEALSTSASNDPHAKKILDPDTARYIFALWEEAGRELSPFKAKLEGWFDRTMEQTSEWYKRKIQVVLLTIGFCIAWLFNVDTFELAGKLSNDKGARDQMVSMADSYLKNNPAIAANPAKLDSLFEVKKMLEKDIANANSILGTGAWLPDSIKITQDLKTREIAYAPQVDASLIPNLDYKLRKALKDKSGKAKQEGYMHITSRCDKWSYFAGLLPRHFFGFLITAIAISLGAPFWFDLLNKLMKLRTSTKQETEAETAAKQSNTGTQPINIQLNTQPGEEAVG